MQAGTAARLAPVPDSPLMQVTLRNREAQFDSLGDLAARLENIADRFMGNRPPSSGANPKAPMPDGLISQLEVSDTLVSDQIQRLRDQVERLERL